MSASWSKLGDRPSVPKPGSSLATVVEARAFHIRAAVTSVRRSFDDREAIAAAWGDVLASRWFAEPLAASAMADLQAAWGLVSMRVVGRSIGALAPDSSLGDAEAWFLGSIRPTISISSYVAESDDREAVRLLELITYDDDLRDLLPYVLDAFGPGSRASVMRDPGTRKARQAKKAAGIFYTPSDVAEYITSEALRELDGQPEHPRILDPACGSGVFLKAALDWAVRRRPTLNRLRFVERSLHGIDVDPLAVQAAAFVLLHECLRGNHRGNEMSPWSVWHRVRCNLCVADALRFHLDVPSEDGSSALGRLRITLDYFHIPPSTDRLDTETATTLFSRGIALGRVFPCLTKGAEAIVGNPPYAKIGPRDDSTDLEHRFASLPIGNVPKSNYFPVFIEMMWRLAQPACSSSGMVVPLSIAYSSRRQMVAMRRSIMGSGGRWRFAFFDREPHALFGEEVKTRNAIIFRYQGDRTSSSTSIETGPLRKWTSRQRERLFDTIGFTPLPGTSIRAGVPKLAGNEPAGVFLKLTRQPSNLRHLCTSVTSCPPGEVASARHRAHVFVSGTAYNFLNVFRPHDALPPRRAPWSSSKLLALGFAGEDEAACAFAILSSRLAYWLWQVTEDGFHVTRSFVLSLPFGHGIYSDGRRDALTVLGAHLWDSVQMQQIVSVNGGRQTIAYRPYGSEHLRDEIDSLLLDSLGIAPAFVSYLRSFTRTVIAVDEKDESRHRLTNHFTVGGK